MELAEDDVLGAKLKFARVQDHLVQDLKRCRVLPVLGNKNVLVESVNDSLERERKDEFQDNESVIDWTRSEYEQLQYNANLCDDSVEKDDHLRNSTKPSCYHPEVNMNCGAMQNIGSNQKVNSSLSNNLNIFNRISPTSLNNDMYSLINTDDDDDELFAELENKRAEASNLMKDSKTDKEIFAVSPEQTDNSIVNNINTTKNADTINKESQLTLTRRIIENESNIINDSFNAVEDTASPTFDNNVAENSLSSVAPLFRESEEINQPVLPCFVPTIVNRVKSPQLLVKSNRNSPISDSNNSTFLKLLKKINSSPNALPTENISKTSQKLTPSPESINKSQQPSSSTTTFNKNVPSPSRAFIKFLKYLDKPCYNYLNYGYCNENHKGLKHSLPTNFKILESFDLTQLVDIYENYVFNYDFLFEKTIFQFARCFGKYEDRTHLLTMAKKIATLNFKNREMQTKAMSCIIDAFCDFMDYSNTIDLIFNELGKTYVNIVDLLLDVIISETDIENNWSSIRKLVSIEGYELSIKNVELILINCYKKKKIHKFFVQNVYNDVIRKLADINLIKIQYHLVKSFLKLMEKHEMESSKILRERLVKFNILEQNNEAQPTFNGAIPDTGVFKVPLPPSVAGENMSKKLNNLPISNSISPTKLKQTNSFYCELLKYVTGNTTQRPTSENCSNLPSLTTRSPPFVNDNATVTDFSSERSDFISVNKEYQSFQSRTSNSFQNRKSTFSLDNRSNVTISRENDVRTNSECKPISNNYGSFNNNRNSFPSNISQVNKNNTYNNFHRYSLHGSSSNRYRNNWKNQKPHYQRNNVPPNHNQKYPITKSIQSAVLNGQATEVFNLINNCTDVNAVVENVVKNLPQDQINCIMQIIRNQGK